MENAIQLLNAAASDSQTLMLGLVFMVVVLLVLGSGGLIAADNAVRRRLKARVGIGGPKANSGVGGAVRSAVSGSDLLRKVEKRLGGAGEEKVSSVRRRLIQAGYMSRNAVGGYFVARIVSGVLLPAVVFALTPLVAGSIAPGQMFLLGILAGLVGFYLPVAWVAQRIQQRQQSAREGFPDALDLLLVCVEAGLSLAAALNRVGKEIGTARPLLGQQLKLVALEMQAGKSREQALRNLSDRIGIDEVRSLVTLLLQSDALGTSIARSLRIHAEEMRKRRLVKAEEQANKLPVKIAIPLVLFILPCLITVIMTPVAIRIIRSFAQT